MTISLEQQLKSIEKQINKILNNNSTLATVFTNSFFSQYTKFTSLDDFFEQGNFPHETKEDLDAIDEKQLDLFIRDNTKFKSWEDMKQMAGNLYAKKELEKAGIKVTLN